MSKGKKELGTKRKVPPPFEQPLTEEQRRSRLRELSDYFSRYGRAERFKETYRKMRQVLGLNK